jgi:hypothetical protein
MGHPAPGEEILKLVWIFSILPSFLKLREFIKKDLVILHYAEYRASVHTDEIGKGSGAHGREDTAVVN